MKKTRSISKALIKVSKKAAKNDINSTSSPWVYQPKLPKNAKDLRK